MKKLLAIGSVTLVLVGIIAVVPAQAHITRGVNCHMNDIFLRGGDTLHFELRISNRSTVAHRNLCEFKFRTSEEIWTVSRVCNLPARTFCTRSGNIHFDGTFRRWWWTHGHVV